MFAEKGYNCVCYLKHEFGINCKMLLNTLSVAIVTSESNFSSIFFYWFYAWVAAIKTIIIKNLLSNNQIRFFAFTTNT